MVEMIGSATGTGIATGIGAVGEPDVPPIFRNAYEERAFQIEEKLETDLRFSEHRSFDFSQLDRLTVTCWEAGRSMVFILTTKTDAVFVDREFQKAIDTYDRGI